MRRSRHAAAAVNLWAPPPFFHDQRNAANNLSAHIFHTQFANVSIAEFDFKKRIF